MKICIATGTRAEYGLLKPLIEKISADDDFILQLLVTGAICPLNLALPIGRLNLMGIELMQKWKCCFRQTQRRELPNLWDWE